MLKAPMYCREFCLCEPRVENKTIDNHNFFVLTDEHTPTVSASTSSRVQQLRHETHTHARTLGRQSICYYSSRDICFSLLSITPSRAWNTEIFPKYSPNSKMDCIHIKIDVKRYPYSILTHRMPNASGKGVTMPHVKLSK